MAQDLVSKSCFTAAGRGQLSTPEPTSAAGTKRQVGRDALAESCRAGNTASKGAESDCPRHCDRPGRGDPKPLSKVASPTETTI